MSKTVNSNLDKIDKFVSGVGKETYRHFEKGGESQLPQSTRNDDFAWRWSTRNSRLINSYPFPENANSFYPGKIILADDKFHSNTPTTLNFKTNERSSINVVTNINSLSSKSFQEFSEVNAGSVINGLKDKFVIPKYKEAGTYITERSDVDIQYFEDSSGFEIAGGITLKDLGLNVDLTNKKSTQILLITIKQEMYQVALNDIYTKASDFFTEKTNYNELCKSTLKNGKYFPLAIVDRVIYGRKVYIAISTSDYSTKLSTKLSKQEFEMKGGFDKSFKNCNFNVKIVGGKSSSFKGLSGQLSLESANKLIENLYKELKAEDILYTAPIEFSASFLHNFRTPTKLTTKIHARYAEKISLIRLNFVRKTYGTLMNLKVNFLHPYKDNNLIRVWKQESIVNKNINDKTLGLISPLSCAFEFNIDKHGDIWDRYDYNVYVPEIPLDKLKRGSDGYFVFTFYAAGSLGSKQHYVQPYIKTYRNLHNVPVLYTSKIKSVFSSEKLYRLLTKEKLMREFNNWIIKLKDRVGWSKVEVV